MEQLKFCDYCRSQITTDKRICYSCYLDYYDEMPVLSKHAIKDGREKIDVK